MRWYLLALATLTNTFVVAAPLMLLPVPPFVFWGALAFLGMFGFFFVKEN